MIAAYRHNNQRWLWGGKTSNVDKCSADDDDAIIGTPVLGYGRSQRRYEMWQNPLQGCSLHIPYFW